MNFFDPVDYTLEENEFIIKHAGEPWIVASRDIHPARLTNPHPKERNPVHYPEGVNPNAVRPILDRIYELLELEKLRGIQWVGVEPIKVAAQTYLEQARTWAADRRRGAPRFPSMHSFDSKGRPHRFGPGSDAGKVRTYFDQTGNRKEFRLELIPSGKESWVAGWAVRASTADEFKDGLINDSAKNRIECSICGHVETYKPESRASFNAARGRMSKHLRKASGDTSRDELHREVHTNTFGSR